VKRPSQKPYSPSPVTVSQRQRFRRLVHPVAGALERPGWSLSGSSATVSRGKTLVVDFFGTFQRGRWFAYIVRETDLMKQNHE
jgi:hypothetical protein